MNAILSGETLQALAPLPLWVVWRNELRRGRSTKVPFNPAGGFAKADDPKTWGTRFQAEAAIPRIVNGSGGGLGLEFAAIGDGLHLAGIDIDTCRDPQTGMVDPWAQEIIDCFGSYAEVSPSGTGVKIFMSYRVSDQIALRKAMGTRHGKSWSRGGGEHPPAIELHISNRYFAVTGAQLHGMPNTIEIMSIEKLLWLICDAGPAFKRTTENIHKTSRLPDRSSDDVLHRLQRAAISNRRLTDVLARMGRYGSRSEAAMALGSAVKAAGWSRDDMVAVLHQHPATAEWSIQKGNAAGWRELDRIWDRANEPSDDALGWGEPDMTVLRLGRRAPPELPLHLLGPAWSQWILDAADAGATSPDYVACSLLAMASALLGNARWPQATPGWREPPHLWIGCVGDSGSNKSSGADCLMRDVLPIIEQRMMSGFPDRLKEWKAQSEGLKAQAEAWSKNVRKAVKNGSAPPPPPNGGPPEPQAPRLRQSDVTVERVATLLAHAAPKGLLIVRDELAGWMLGLTSYNEAGRAFWIEAYGGRPYRVERQKSPEPINVPRLAVAVNGGTQPEKLAEMFKDADDGLLARFIWSWPEPRRFRLSRTAPGAEWAIEALDRLRMLDLAPDDKGELHPVNVPLVEGAIVMMEKFGQEMQAAQQEAGGLLRSAYGKARGLALRLSLVIAMLKWCGQDSFAPPPASIAEDDLAAACEFVRDYFMPMAARVYGDAAASQADRNAATLARWITRERPSEVHVRDLQREVRLPGLNAAGLIHGAAEVLIEAGWLQAPPAQKGFQIRPKAYYPVNPKLLELQPQADGHPDVDL